MAAYRQRRRDERYYRAVARQIVMHEQRPDWYVYPVELLRKADRRPIPHVNFLSFLPGAREVNDEIDQWHESDSIASLRVWLGLSEDEHETWMRTGFLPAHTLLWDENRICARDLGVAVS